MEHGQAPEAAPRRSFFTKYAIKPATGTYAFKTCGKEWLNELALQWCLRSQYVFAVWVDSPNKDMVFTEEDWVAYRPPEDFVEKTATLAHEHPVLVRYAEDATVGPRAPLHAG